MSVKEDIATKIQIYLTAIKANVIHSHDDVFLTNQILNLILSNLPEMSEEEIEKYYKEGFALQDIDADLDAEELEMLKHLLQAYQSKIKEMPGGLRRIKNKRN